MAMPPEVRVIQDISASAGARDGGRADPVEAKTYLSVPRPDRAVTIHVSRGAVPWQGRCQVDLQTTPHLTISASPKGSPRTGAAPSCRGGGPPEESARAPGPGRQGRVKAGRFLRERLRAKVLALVVGILLLGFGLLLALSLERERHALEERHRETARLLAASILTAVENGMLEARPDIIRRLLQELRAQLRDVRRIDVYRRNGVEAFTDLETVEAVNSYVGLEPELIRRITRLQRAPGQRLDHPLFRRAVETEDTGEHSLKNVAQPVRSTGWCPPASTPASSSGACLVVADHAVERPPPLGVAGDAPAHREGRHLGHALHGLDGAVAGLAGEPHLHVPLVGKVRRTPPACGCAPTGWPASGSSTRGPSAPRDCPGRRRSCGSPCSARRTAGRRNARGGRRHGRTGSRSRTSPAWIAWLNSIGWTGAGATGRSGWPRRRPVGWLRPASGRRRRRPGSPARSGAARRRASAEPARPPPPRPGRPWPGSRRSRGFSSRPSVNGGGLIGSAAAPGPSDPPVGPWHVAQWRS